MSTSAGSSGRARPTASSRRPSSRALRSWRTCPEEREPARAAAERLQRNRGDDHGAADERRPGRLLPARAPPAREPHPERAEHDLEQRDERDLGSRYALRTEREEREPESRLARAEAGEHPQVIPADVSEARKRRGAGEEDDLREAGRRHHRDVGAVPGEEDAPGEGERHDD